MVTKSVVSASLFELLVARAERNRRAHRHFGERVFRSHTFGDHELVEDRPSESLERSVRQSFGRDGHPASSFASAAESTANQAEAA